MGRHKKLKDEPKDEPKNEPNIDVKDEDEPREVMPRYVAGLRDVTDSSCYKDFFESDTLEEAQKEADFAAEKHGRNTIVFDRRPFGDIVYRKVVQTEEKAAVVTPPVKQKQMRKRKETKPVEVKVADKDAYFD
jgi:hypothetical protein